MILVNKKDVYAVMIELETLYNDLNIFADDDVSVIPYYDFVNIGGINLKYGDIIIGDKINGEVRIVEHNNKKYEA